MQFLWRYMDELVGKGLSLAVVAEIVFYAAMHLVPTALPLGILLASLITFGNLGERLELLSMKASGVSLYRIMRPLFVAVVCVALWLFHFQNNFMITAQVRMWTLLYSARFSAPELEIPEKSFYNGIDGISMFVNHRDKKTGRLNELMIYDYKNGIDKTRIIRADSGRIAMDDSKLFLSLRLYNGQSFENLEEPMSLMSTDPISHAKERFASKEILIPFDANFNRRDEKEIGALSVGKNLSELTRAIDTAQYRIDSLRLTTSVSLSDISIGQRYTAPYPQSQIDTTEWAKEARQTIQTLSTSAPTVGLDSLMRRYGLQDSIAIYNRAASAMMTMKFEVESRLYNDNDAFKTFRTNSQDWHRKFTFPAACLVFFLIGAPLGAIIRKGGLGAPVVASFLFFIIYYIIDSLGQNLVRTESLSVQVGMWLSTYVLLPIGLFLCYMAAKEAAGLNSDIYLNVWQRLTGSYIAPRQVEAAMIPSKLTYVQMRSECLRIRTLAEDMISSEVLTQSTPRLFVHATRYTENILRMHDEVETLVAELRGCDHPLVVSKLKDLPILPRRLSPFPLPSSTRRGKLLLALVPISLPLLLGLRSGRKHLDVSLRALSTNLAEIVTIFDASIRMHQPNTL